MNLKFTNPILPIGEIKIKKAFSDHTPRLEKLKECMDFYRDNGRFDRQIIVDGDKTLRDGYCAYLTAYLLDVKMVEVLMVREMAVTRNHATEQAGYNPAGNSSLSAFKIGDTVKIVYPRNGCLGAEGLIGKVTRSKMEKGLTRGSSRINVSTNDGIWCVNEDGCELYAVQTGEINSEPMKLCCVKDYGNSIKRGHTGVFDPEVGGVVFGGISLGIVFGSDTFEQRKERNKTRAPHFYPLVRRPAKVGEWVYISSPWQVPIGDYGIPLYKIGDVMKITGVGCKGTWFRFADGESNGTQCVLNLEEYLVLDGYKGDAE